MNTEQMQQDYNDAIEFTLKLGGIDGTAFLEVWNEGDWECIERDFPEFKISDALRHPKPEVIKPINTSVTVTYSNGETRQFVASDNLEQLINEGHMFSVTTMHSDINLDEEKSVSKMYAGNPMAAMGYMMMMHRNADTMPDEDKNKKIILEVLSTCISFLKDEVTSHQSGMVNEERITQEQIEGRIHRNNQNSKIVDIKVNGDNESKDRKYCHVIENLCEYYGCQIDRNNDVAIEHCGHPDNLKDEEGNCTSLLCPLCTESA